MKDPENFLRSIRNWKRIAVQWQLDLVKKVVNQNWFDFETAKFYSCECTALLGVWILETYNSSQKYRLEKEAKEKEEESK
jgi:hypothetical protein